MFIKSASQHSNIALKIMKPTFIVCILRSIFTIENERNMVNGLYTGWYKVKDQMKYSGCCWEKMFNAFYKTLG